MTQPSRAYWQRWADALRRHQLHEWVAALLESASPFTFLGAQALHFSGGLIASPQVASLARMLEDEDETRAFADFLTSGRIPQ